jgi:glycosyltransferase involved in cell wall biosynthesis
MLPLSDKIGWPWSAEDAVDSSLSTDNLEYPKITIVIPNYNYGCYLEETIRSILLQGYPNLESIVIDGGSTDNSVEIIKKYEPWLTYWESEADRGQTHAINKGLARATGEIFNWINSDDILMPGALLAIGRGMQNHDAFVGVVNNFDDGGKSEKVVPQNITSTGLLTRFNTTNKPAPEDTVYHQPGFWFKTEYLKKIGALNEQLSIQFDFDRVVRYLYHYPSVNYSDRILVNFRCHPDQKTSPTNNKQEGQIIAKSIIADPDYQMVHQPARTWLDRLIWYDRLAGIMQQSESSRLFRAVKILLLSCRNPTIYWTRYTFGGIRLLLTK